MVPLAVRFLVLVLALGWFAMPSPAQDKPARQLRIIVFGAHPDDAELKAGGTALKWTRLGHAVKMVSVTNGDIGHWKIHGEELAKRRLAEVKAADAILGAETEVLPIHDGELEPTLANRNTIIRLIREWKADIVIAHRPWDYHPDHRYVGVLVQDAAFMVTVPFAVPGTKALDRNPVFLYSSDRFQKPYRFRPDVIVDIGDTIDKKLDALHELESQLYEGGALGNETVFRTVPGPKDVARRKEWLRAHPWGRRNSADAALYRDAIGVLHGPDNRKDAKFVEAFELCEYGHQPTAGEWQELFPFNGKKASR